MSPDPELQVEILTQLGVMSEKLSSIDKRLGKHEETLDSVVKILTGDGHDRIGLAHEVLSCKARLDALENNKGALEAKIEALEAKNGALSAELKEQKRIALENPSLLWLVRFRPRQTVPVIVIVFVILSLWWISGWRQPILEFFGLPIF